MFHVGMWRERMRDALAAAVESREYRLPGTRDEINDAELAAGIGTPLSDASARADHLLTEVGSLLQQLGARPVQWFAAVSGTDAVLRNSYSHPRGHMCEYLIENGEVGRARTLLDESLGELDRLSAQEYVTTVLTSLRDKVKE